MGAGNHPRTRKGQERGPRHRGRGHHGRRHDPHPGKAYHDGGTSAAPPPANAARLPGMHTPNTHRRSNSRTPYGSHQRTLTSHRKPHGGWRAHLHGGNGLHPQRKLQGTPPRSAPPRIHRQTTTPAATRATTQAPGEDNGTATAPRARDRDPQRTRDQGKGPAGGATPRTPTRPTSLGGTPRPPQHGPSEPPTPYRTPQPPASHTPTHTPHHDTGQADLHQPNTAQHETARHTAPQHATVQRTTTTHPKAQHTTARRDTTRHRAAQHGTADPDLKD